VVNIEAIDTEDANYAPVIKVFNSYGTAALPIITLDGRPVCMATVVPEQIIAALERQLKRTAGE